MVSPVSALSAFLPPFLPFLQMRKSGGKETGGKRDFKKEKRRRKLFSRSGGGGMAEGGGEAEIQRIALWRLGGRENGAFLLGHVQRRWWVRFVFRRCSCA